MAVCDDCNQEMLVAASCTLASIDLIDGTYRRVRFGSERPSWQTDRCGDCNVALGGLHHLGCDVERCPDCSYQLISCDCWEEDPEQTDAWAAESFT